jgi:hypothetical protein
MASMPFRFCQRYDIHNRRRQFRVIPCNRNNNAFGLIPDPSSRGWGRIFSDNYPNGRAFI